MIGYDFLEKAKELVKYEMEATRDIAFLTSKIEEMERGKEEYENLQSNFKRVKKERDMLAEHYEDVEMVRKASYNEIIEKAKGMVGRANDTKRAEEEYEKIYIKLQGMTRDRDYWRKEAARVTKYRDKYKDKYKKQAEKVEETEVKDQCKKPYNSVFELYKAERDEYKKQADFHQKRYCWNENCDNRFSEELGNKPSSVEKIEKTETKDQPQPEIKEKPKEWVCPTGGYSITSDTSGSKVWTPVNESEVFRMRFKCKCGKVNWAMLELDNPKDSE